MALPPELDAVLTDLSDPRKCTADIVERTRKLLAGHSKKPESGAAKAPTKPLGPAKAGKRDNVGTAPPPQLALSPNQAGAFAMRLLNLAGKTLNSLSSADATTVGTTDSSATAAAVVVEASQLAVDTLASIEKAVGIPPLSVERSLLMLASKCLDFKLLNSARTFLFSLRDRLAELVGGSSAKLAGDIDAITAKLKATSLKARGPEKAREKKSSAAASKGKAPVGKATAVDKSGTSTAPATAAKKSLPLPLPRPSKTSEDVSVLVFNYLGALVRFLVASAGSDDSTNEVIEAVKSWTAHLASLDAQIASKQVEAFYRSIMRQEGPSIATTLGASKALSLFYVSTASPLPTTFHDMVMHKGGKVFHFVMSESAESPSAKAMLLSFYRAVFEAADTLPRGFDYEPALVAWTDQFAFLLRKERLRAEAEMVSSRLLRCVSASLVQRRSSNMFLLGLCYELERYADCVEEPDLYHSLELELHEMALEDNGQLSSAGSGVPEGNCKRYLKASERFRRAASSTLALIGKSTGSSSHVQVKLNILAVIRSCGSVLEQLAVLLKGSSIDFGPPQLEVQLFLSRLLAMLESERKGAQIDLRQLDRAKDLAKAHATSEQLLAMANVFYVQGTASFKDGRYADASKAIAESCSLVAQALAAADRTRAGDEAHTETAVTLAKRKETLATCLHLEAKNEDAIATLLDAAQGLLPVISAESVQDNHADQALASIFDRYFKWQLTKDGPAADVYKSIVAQIVNKASGVSIDTRRNLLQRELSLLQAAEAGYHDAQLAVVDLILESLSEKEESGVPRSELLITKARIIRSMPNGSLTDALEAATGALDLLKSCSGPSDNLELLAAAYALQGVLRAMSGSFDGHAFRLAMHFWNRLLSQVPDQSATSTGRPVGQTAPAAPKNASKRALPANQRTTSKGPLQPPARNAGPSSRTKKVTKEAATVAGAEVSAQPSIATRSPFANAEQALADAKYAADVLGIQSQLMDRIRMLRICLRMNAFRQDRNVAVQDAVSLECSVGHAYLILGYTGQAGLAYHRAKALVEAKGTNDPLTDVLFNLGYSYYLSCIGNLEKSKTAYDQAVTLAKDANVLEPTEGAGHEIREQNRRIRLAASNAFAVQTAFQFAQGNMAVALKNTQQALQLLIETASKEARKNGAPTGTQGPTPESDSALFRRLGRARLETVLELLLCLENLGQMLLIRGSPGEAELYFRRGLELSKSINSAPFQDKFHLCLAETDYRRLRLEDSGLHIKELNSSEEFCPDSTKDLAFRHMRVGDLSFRQGELGDAEKRYETARKVLDHLAAPTFMAAIENTQPHVAPTPRETVLLQNTRPQAVANKKVISDPSAPTKAENFLLSYVKTELLARLGSTSLRQGKVPDAEQRLNAGSAEDQSALDQAEFLVTLGTLHLFKAMQSMSSSSFMDNFFDSVFSLPWVSFGGSPPQKASKTAKTPRKAPAGRKAANGQAALSSAIQETEEILQDAFSVCMSYGFPKLFQDACYGLVVLKMFQVYSMKGSLAAKQGLWDAAFYLHKRNGITAIRETQSLLLEKTDPTASRTQRVRWPEASPTNHSEASARFRRLHELRESEMTVTPLDFRETYVEILPSTWVVCSLSIDEERDDLVLSRLRKGKDPMIVRMPLRRQANRDNGNEDCLGYKGVIAELADILASSDATLQQASQPLDRNGRVEWWNTRKVLDERLGSLLGQIETTWLGAFKSLLLPDLSFSEETSTLFKERLEQTLRKALRGATSSSSGSLTIDASISDSLLRLGDEPEDNDVEDFLYFILESFRAAGASVDLGEVDMDLLTVDIKEVIAHIYEDAEEETVPETEHLILVLDRSTQPIPWESLPSLRNLEISRLPSLTFLRDRIMLAHEWTGSNMGPKLSEPGEFPYYAIDATKSSYVLNPGGDLTKTQQRFEQLFARESWKGVVGKPPTDREMNTLLTESDVFMYFGHNGGEQFVRGHDVRKLDRCAVALLIGCSSGRLKDLGEFEPMGTAMHYLMAGCPTIVGNLWDVTDKDIDQFAMKMMSDWGLFNDDSRQQQEEDEDEGSLGPSIAACVAAARDECTLRYLNGAAPVVYGVPSFVLKRSESW